MAPGRSFGQKSDLASMVRFVLANMEPFPTDIYLLAAIELLCIGGWEPLVISFAEFGEGVFTGLVEDVEIVVEVVALDGFATAIAKVHRRVPTSLSMRIIDCMPLIG